MKTADSQPVRVVPRPDSPPRKSGFPASMSAGFFSPKKSGFPANMPAGFPPSPPPQKVRMSRQHAHSFSPQKSPDFPPTCPQGLHFFKNNWISCQRVRRSSTNCPGAPPDPPKALPRRGPWSWPGSGKAREGKSSVSSRRNPTLEHASGSAGIHRIHRKWWQQLLLGPHLPHALGVRMT